MRAELVAVCLLFCITFVSSANVEPSQNEDISTILDEVIPPNLSDAEKQATKMQIAKRIRDTIKIVKQFDTDALQKTVQTNFFNGLLQMANGSATTTAEVSRAAGTLIRGLVQDQLTFGSIGVYLPRLIFLDGPSQFIETLKLIRSNQIRAPTDLNSAIDTLINFAQHARESQIAMNLGGPSFGLFANVFRGAELLNTELLHGVFSWLTPIQPADISASAVEGLWNRWDTKSSTTTRPRIQKPLFTEMKPSDPIRVSI